MKYEIWSGTRIVCGAEVQGPIGRRRICSETVRRSFGYAVKGKKAEFRCDSGL